MAKWEGGKVALEDLKNKADKAYTELNEQVIPEMMCLCFLMDSYFLFLMGVCLI